MADSQRSIASFFNSSKECSRHTDLCNEVDSVTPSESMSLLARSSSLVRVCLEVQIGLTLTLQKLGHSKDSQNCYLVHVVYSANCVKMCVVQ